MFTAQLLEITANLFEESYFLLMKNKKVAETLKFKSNLSELNYINVS